MADPLSPFAELSPPWDERGPCDGPRDCVGTERGCSVCDPCVPEPFAELSPPYSTIVADPPWRYGIRKRDAYKRVLPPAYSSMSVGEVASLSVADLADDSRLFLWITNNHLRYGWDVIESWGFTPSERVLVWCKQPRATTPVTTEFVLMGKRGKPPRMPWHGTTWFDWPLQRAHSAKPAAFYDLVESWCPGPYVELFARQPRLGWDSWGYGYEGVA